MAQKAVKENSNNTIFALDIGTRSIVGIAGNVFDDSFSIFDYEQRMHRVRAMRDGQIEDINLVVKTAMEIKEALEERNGITLKKVSIAAAGRSLRTVRSIYEQDINEDENITTELLRSIEYNAVSATLDNFTAECGTDNAYSCVGYDVITYKLDGYLLNNPLNHRGGHIVIEIIAAFLPFSVVRSLYAVMGLCGLTVDSLTLEPIAAINAVVPPDVRLLNIAITDIGAGTSDIGISKHGSIIAYDMVTVAGDEVTESLMKNYLVDFDTGEAIKFKLSENNDQIAFSDILGINHTCSKEAILSTINPVLEELCGAIADSILRINDGPPTALFLVGGGSQIPGLCAKIAGRLNIPVDRVTLGGKHPYKNITLHTDELLTPEFVTPIGIAASSRLTRIHDLFSVTVNGEKVTLPDTESTSVMDALLMAGVKASNLIGRSATPLVYYIGEEKKNARGTPPIPGQIYVNKETSTIDTLIRQGDEITVFFAKHGAPAKITVSDVVKPDESGKFPAVFINDKRAKKNSLIKNNDVLTFSSDVEQEPEEPAATFEYIELPGPAAAGLEPAPTKPAKTMRVNVNDEWLQVPYNDGETPLFLDMLNFINIDMKKAKGDLILTINDIPASYTDLVRDGDKVRIMWSE